MLLFHFSVIYVSNLLFGFIGFRVATCLGELLTRFAMFRLVVGLLCCTSFPGDIVGGVRNPIVTVPDTCLF